MNTCPKCKLVNPPDAVRCDCGYDFSSGKMAASYLHGKTAQNLSFSLGTVYACLCFFGCLVAAWFITRILLHATQTGDWRAGASPLVAFVFMIIVWSLTGVAILRRKKYAITLSYVGAGIALLGIIARGIVPLDIILALPSFTIVFYLRNRSDLLT